MELQHNTVEPIYLNASMLLTNHSRALELARDKILRTQAVRHFSFDLCFLSFHCGP